MRIDDYPLVTSHVGVSSQLCDGQVSGLYLPYVPDVGRSWCSRSFCECDAAAVDCLALSSYNSSLKNLPETFCAGLEPAAGTAMMTFLVASRGQR